MKLTNPTDDQLDAAFAIEIVGYKMLRQEMFGTHFVPRWCPPGTPDAVNMLALDTKPPGFTRSFDAVLPWLEKHEWWEICQDRTIEKTHSPYWCSIFYDKGEEYDSHQGSADTAPLAAVIALLRADGHEIEFT